MSDERNGKKGGLVASKASTDKPSTDKVSIDKVYFSTFIVEHEISTVQDN